MEDVFRVRLGRAIEAGFVTLGKFDGARASIAFASGSCGQVLVYDPHETKDISQCEVRAFHFNRQVCALASGRLKPTADHDILLVGLPCALLAYDIESNADVFYKEVNDGVNCVAIGQLKGVGVPLAFVGGNCSVFGFTAGGSEEFWTVAGDNVYALTTRPSDQSLIFGSDDYDIKVVQADEAIVEVTEADKISHLVAFDQAFGFGLTNGTIGVYHGAKRQWRVKSRHKLTALCSFYHFVHEWTLLAGWSNGSVTLRSATTGAAIFRDSMGAHKVSAILVGDLRSSGSADKQLIVASASGELRGYSATTQQMQQQQQHDDDDGNSAELAALYTQLHARKKELTHELHRLEIDKSTSAASTESIPAGTRVSVDMRVHEDGYHEMVCDTNSDAVIVCVVILDTEGGLFEDESLVVFPSQPSSQLRVSFCPKKNVACVCQVQAHVGSRASSQCLHVFDLEFAVPTFCTLVRQAPPAEQQPLSYVQFKVPVELSALVSWISMSFINMGSNPKADSPIQVFYASSSTELWIEAGAVPGHSSCCDVKILTDSMSLAAEVVQDMVTTLQISELASVCEFPVELGSLEEILERVDEYNTLRIKLTADMADATHTVKTLVVKIEDARLLSDMTLLKRHLLELFHLNTQLIAEYQKRANNHHALMAALKEVNQIIQKAANLRAGPFKATLVADCRKAIKTNAFRALYHIICQGRSVSHPSRL